MSKWTELRLLLDKHAEALKAVFTSEYGVQITVDVKTIEFGAAGELLMEFPERLCLISSPTEPFDTELHLLLPGELLTTLVNHYFGGGSLPAPMMPSRVTPSEQRIGERVSKTFFSRHVRDLVRSLPPDLRGFIRRRYARPLFYASEIIGLGSSPL